MLDRVDNIDGNSDAEYAVGGSDTSDNANPFTDGDGNDIGSDEHFLYRVDGGAFSPFADKTITDESSGNNYVEHQALWLNCDNRFDTDEDDIVGTLNFLAYSLKYDGPGGKEMGIPVCTKANNLWYGYCKSDADDANIDDATETHRVKIMFLGEEWIISEMSAPAADAYTENKLMNGGYIKLAKESVSGILNQGESLPVDNLKFQLDALEAHGETTSAIISILDAKAGGGA